MNNKISLNSHLTPENAALVARGRQLKERADSVKASLQSAPSDLVQLDARNSNERLGALAYTGAIGEDRFASAQASVRDGKIDAFAAHDPIGNPGETVKFHYSTTQATGLRAGIAAAFGGIAGGLEGVGVWFLAQAMTSENVVASKACEVASMPFLSAGNVANFLERKISDPGTRDEYYAVSSPNGDYEQFLFTANNTVEHDFFPATSKSQVA